MNNYYNPPINHTGYFQPYYSPKEAKKDEIKKKCSHIGFLLVVAVVVMNLAAIVMEVVLIAKGKFDLTMKTGMQGIPYTAVFLMNGIPEFLAFFLTPLIFCLIIKMPLSEAVPIKNNRRYNIFALTFAGYSVCVIANIAVSLLNFNLGLFGIDNSIDMNFGTDTVADKIAYFVCVAIVPALTEEFIFRGVILNYLRPYGSGFAIIVSSVLFGLVHGNFVQIPFAFIVGLVAGFMTVKTGTIVPAVLLHLLNNGGSVIMDMLTKAYDPDGTLYIEYTVLTVLLILSSVTLFFIITKRDFDIKTADGSSECSLSISDRIRCFLSNGGIITALVIFVLLAFLAMSSSEIINSVQK